MPLNGQSRQGRVIINFFEEAVRRGLASHEEYSEPANLISFLPESFRRKTTRRRFRKRLWALDFGL
jgi:hypothetical protein